MEKRWTEEQAEAIASRNQNLLLSAAAGSGKTSVLVGRIIARLTDRDAPVDADRLLVVTFTNAAAAEMRERIITGLETLIEERPDDSFLANQLLLVKKAQITTIDAFCINLLKKNFIAAQLPPDFRMMDTNENTVLRGEVLEEVLSEMYDDPVFSRQFLDLLEAYANAKANDKSLREVLHGLYLFVMSLPAPEKWLHDAAEMFHLHVPFSQTHWYEILMKEAKLLLEKMAKDCDVLASLAESDGPESYVPFMRNKAEELRVIGKLDTYSSIQEALAEYKPGSRPACKTEEQAQYKHFEYLRAEWETLKKELGKLREDFFSITEEEQEAAIRTMYPLMQCVSEIIVRLHRKLLERKMKRNMMDFSDCEHLCLKLLTKADGTPSETARQIQQQFDEIYIDEYQDTSRLQEAIFSAIKRENNLFMVGDIKQSIYRFRNTDPSLFQLKRDSFSKDSEAINRKIILSSNFRSRESVLDFINYIFERIMSKETGEIDYDDSEKLYAGGDFSVEAPNPIDTDTELCLIDVSAVKASMEEQTNADDTEKAELEAKYIARRIAELIESEVQILSGNVYRNIRYSDICIISRGISYTAPILVDVLTEHGIPCFSNKTGGFLNSSEVSLLTALLAVIDNPYQDLPLLSVLRSVLFRFTADDLAKIRCFDKRKTFYEAMNICAESDSGIGKACKEFLQTLETFREKATYMSVSELVMDIYHVTGFYDAQRCSTNGELRRANLRLLYERAVAYEKTGLKGLYSFIRFLSDYQAAGSDLEGAQMVSSGQDAVQIMSIHGSKGLEFPVVILYGLGTKFNMRDTQKSLLYHMHLGYGPKFVDTDLRITYPFAPRIACRSVLQKESKAEEMRILYVAMTRAKEKLILVGSVHDITSQLNACVGGGKNRRIDESVIATGNNYLTWILTALMNHPDCELLRKNCDVSCPICMDNSRVKIEIIRKAEELYLDTLQEKIVYEDEENSVDISKLLSLISYSYPNLQDTVLPSKITVTELKRRINDQEEEGVYMYPRPVALRSLEKTLTGAMLGVAYHTVMQHIPIDEVMKHPDRVKEQILEIKERGFLTEEEAKAVSAEQIAALFASEIGEILLKSQQVMREVMFGIHRPANTLLSAFQSEKNIMLQGVIDCVAETEDGLYVIDYKTDRAEKAEDLAKKYDVQLECYRMAAEQIFGKKVIGKLLYSFALGEVIHI